MEDPFFVVKHDVERSLDDATRTLQELRRRGGSPRDEDCVAVEKARTSLRSVGYDLEDLEETIRIVESNPRKFKIDSREIQDRRNFVTETKRTVDELLQSLAAIEKSKKTTQKSPSHRLNQGHINKYSKLEEWELAETDTLLQATHQEQRQILERQDEELDLVSGSVSRLKDMGYQIGDELDEQNEILDDMGSEMEKTHSKMDNVMHKVAKVTRLSTDRRQWTVIISLVVAIIIIFFFLIIL